jgi:hypothetical protein
MGDHASGHVDGRRACDSLLHALRMVLPACTRKHARNMCAVHLPGEANFAYVYHVRRAPRLRVWFPSRASEHNAPLRSIHPLRRAKVDTPWARNWAWWFDVESPDQGVDGAEFLYPFASRERRRGAAIPTHTTIAEEVDESSVESFVEGAAARILVNRYERDPKARRRCIEHHGAMCQACGFAFARYGTRHKDLITVHHVRPLSATRTEYRVDPIIDLVPLCANCHLVAHQQSPPYTVQELRTLLARGSPEYGVR